MIYYSLANFEEDCRYLVQQIKNKKRQYCAIYGIPQGGVPLAMELSRLLNIPLITALPATIPKQEILLVDDLVDSGATISRFPGYDLAAIHIKTHTPLECFPTYYCHRVPDWVTYWWEATKEKSIADNITRIIQFIGENPKRPGLLETPARVVKSWQELFAGYNQDPADIFKVFDEDGYNELVWLKNIEFYSMCEHHMLPFYGKAHVAYIASDNRVVGVSKLARLVDIFARRLSTQERIAKQVTETLMTHLKPRGAACIIEGIHLCMRCRGVGKQDSIMGTSCLRGRFLEETPGGIAARAELMSLIK